MRRVGLATVERSYSLPEAIEIARCYADHRTVAR